MARAKARKIIVAAVTASLVCVLAAACSRANQRTNVPEPFASILPLCSDTGLAPTQGADESGEPPTHLADQGATEYYIRQCEGQGYQITMTLSRFPTREGADAWVNSIKDDPYRRDPSWPFDVMPDNILLVQEATGPDADMGGTLINRLRFRVATFGGELRSIDRDVRWMFFPNGEDAVVGDTYGDANLQRLLNDTLVRWDATFRGQLRAQRPQWEVDCYAVAAAQAIGKFGEEEGNLRYSADFIEFLDTFDAITKSAFFSPDRLRTSYADVLGKAPFERADWRELFTFQDQEYERCAGKPYDRSKSDSSVDAEDRCAVQTFTEAQRRLGKTAIEYSAEYREWLINKLDSDTLSASVLVDNEQQYTEATERSPFTDPAAVKLLRTELESC